MKYYINYTTQSILKDENKNTPYLIDRGYVEVSKEVYDAYEQTLLEKWAKENNKLDEV